MNSLASGFVLLASALLAGAHAEPPPCPRPVYGRADLVECIGLGSIHPTPMGADSLDIRIWREKSRTGMDLTRITRFDGHWAATTYAASRATAIIEISDDPYPQSWADRWAAALAAGLDTLPPDPASSPDIPRDDGEHVILAWASGSDLHEVRSNRPFACDNASDRAFAAVLTVLTLQLC